MPQGKYEEETAYSVITPVVVIRPMLWAALSVNHNAPSEPVAMDWGMLLAVGIAYSVIVPEVVMRPILSLPPSVNHSAPSGAVVMD